MVVNECRLSYVVRCSGVSLFFTGKYDWLIRSRLFVFGSDLGVLLFYWLVLILFHVFAVILVLMLLFLNNIICGTVSSIFHYF